MSDRTSTEIESIPPLNVRISPATMPLPSGPPCTVTAIGPIDPACTFVSLKASWPLALAESVMPAIRPLPAVSSSRSVAWNRLPKTP